MKSSRKREADKGLNPDAIFHGALEIGDAAKRALFLDKACHGDPLLRKKVAALLTAEACADTFFETSAVGLNWRPGNQTVGQPRLDALTEGPGTVMGNYELVEELGKGGFGIVYRARQTAPVRREVAVKIIKLGMDTREVVRRFEAERQALALMAHPNIATVYDAGATAAGRPYFVMELVPGRPITTYCNTQVLGLQERLQLFVQVCKAVQHAHQKGMIHRDLKPSNILVIDVDGAPRPKIIDFGIVKATGQPLTTDTFVTSAHEMIGTPAYMSPEQASLGPLDIDTRSDVFALGVVLYELLTGCPPLESQKLESSSLEVVLQAIREQEPPNPSARLGGLSGPELRAVAGARQCLALELIRLVRGELDWIVMKAVDKDRTRRYESASALAEDIERFLNHEPVAAAAPGTAYQIRKFARRYRTAFVTAGTIAVILVLSSVISGWLAIRASHAEQRSTLDAANARRQAAIAEATRKFLTDDMLGAADPMQVNRHDLRVRDALDQAAVKLDGQFQNEPMAEAEIRATLARIYSNLGDHKSALIHASRTLALRERELGETNRETLRAQRSVAIEYLGLRSYHPEYLNKAETLLRASWNTCRSILPAGDEVTVDAATALASVLFAREQYPAAFQLTEQALCAWTNAHGLFNPRAASILASFAGDYALCPAAEKDPAREQHRFELALAVSRNTFGEKNPNNVLRLINLGMFCLNTGQLTMAEAHLLQAVALAKEALGNTHPWTWAALRELTRLRLRQGKTSEAITLAEEEIADRLQVQAQSDPAAIDAVTRIGDEFEKQGARMQAAEFYRAGLKRLGSGRPPTAQSLTQVAYWMVATADYSSADELLGILEQTVANADPDSPSYSVVCRRALLALNCGQHAAYSQACQRLTAQFATTKTPQIASAACRVYLATPNPRPNEQTHTLQHWIALAGSGSQSTDTNLQASVWLTLGLERYRAGDLDKALEHLQAAAAGSPICQATAQLLLALVHQQCGESSAAQRLFAQAESAANEIEHSRYSWWDEYLLFMILQQEAQKELAY